GRPLDNGQDPASRQLRFDGSAQAWRASQVGVVDRGLDHIAARVVGWNLGVAAAGENLGYRGADVGEVSIEPVAGAGAVHDIAVPADRRAVRGLVEVLL